ncbi:MAG: hypothetical protein R3E39_17845 [Anaerolineae bacterium]
MFFTPPPDAHHPIRLGAYPLQIAGNVRLLAQGIEGVQFFEQGLVGEKIVQGFVTGNTQINHLAPAFRTWNEVVLGDVAHFPFAQGAVLRLVGLAWQQRLGRAAFHGRHIYRLSAGTMTRNSK